MDTVMQRRPSISSLSSASGYSSSNYGSGEKLSTQRLTTNRNLQSSWINQSTTTPSNVGPWIEQQQTLDSLDITNANNNNTHNTSINTTTSTTTNTNNEADDDELIPTAIVIKNIPFAIKKEQLLDVMTKLNLPLPYAFNYHFDNGVFRGLAFANFTSTDETSLVVNQLNGREIGGRKLRVEYKKMLPLQERERIEREKREKRGQLEEQHRSASNASLASLLSAASTTAATKNLSVAGGITPSHTTERLFLNLPFSNVSFNPPPMEINFNDPEILELYTQLVLYRDDLTKSIFELAISPINLNMSQKKIISILCNYVNLLELFDNGLVIIRRKPGHIVQSIAQQSSLPISSQQHQQQQQQANQQQLLRSQSQSALPLPRLRQQTSTPNQQQQQQQQQQEQQQQQQQQHQQQYATQGQVATPTLSSSSAAALLRSSSNRSYVDVRSTPPLNNNFIQQQQQQQPSIHDSPNAHHQQSLHHQQYYGGGFTSQPQTPLTSNPDVTSRFQPFGQHAHLTSSFTSLSQTLPNSNQGGNTTNLDDFNAGDNISAKLNNLGLNVGGGGSNANSVFDSGSSGSGIWGPK
ncbi:PIN4 RNA-binding protein PIN4 [Candida maltosa Xu316]